MCYTTVITDFWLKRKKKVTIKPSEKQRQKTGLGNS